MDSEAFLEVNNESPPENDGAEADRQTDRQEGLEDKSAAGLHPPYMLRQEAAIFVTPCHLSKWFAALIS